MVIESSFGITRQGREGWNWSIEAPKIYNWYNKYLGNRKTLVIHFIDDLWKTLE